MDRMKAISEKMCSINSEPVFIMVFKGNAKEHFKVRNDVTELYYENVAIAIPEATDNALKNSILADLKD